MTDDRITISRLKVPAHIGVGAAERERLQNIFVTLELVTDLRAAAASDALDDTIDYDHLTTSVADLVRASEAHLLEHLAGEIASHVCASPKVDRVTVEVMKESPPVAEEVGPISVRITRP